MKYSVFTKTLTLAAVLTAAPVAFAVDDHHPAGKQADKSSTSVDKGAMDDKKMSQMQDHMLRMHEQMHKIMQAKNTQERERLMQEHRQMMREHMQAMHGNKGMMDHGQMGTRKMDESTK